MVRIIFNFVYAVLPILIVFSSGCSPKRPFTQSLIKEYDLTPDEIKRLQFYVSNGLLLERESMNIDKDINDEKHSLNKVEDKYIKQIYFRRKTPCIVNSVGSTKMDIAFEEDDQLLFKVAEGEDSKDIFYYAPDTKIWPPEKGTRSSGAGYRFWKKAGTEKYADSTFTVYVRLSHYPYLLVDEKSLKKIIVDKRRVKGMRQSEQY